MSRPLRFGAAVLPNRPVELLRERWRTVEELGLNSLWCADHVQYGSSGQTWFEGWTLLAAISAATERIRIGPLVASITNRSPALLAKQAVTIDHLSGGRLTLGIGAAGTSPDHLLLGEEPWAPGERTERFREYVTALDGLLRGASRFEGRYYRSGEVALGPPPLQRPRPPLLIAAWGPKNIRLAAEFGETWNTMGGEGLDSAQGLETVRRQSETLSEACVELGRDPATIGRSLLQAPHWIDEAPFASQGAFEAFVTRYRNAGIDEFVFFYPPEEIYPQGSVEPGLFERLARRLLPELRAA